MVYRLDTDSTGKSGVLPGGFEVVTLLPHSFQICLVGVVFPWSVEVVHDADR